MEREEKAYQKDFYQFSFWQLIKMNFMLVRHIIFAIMNHGK